MTTKKKTDLNEQATETEARDHLTGMGAAVNGAAEPSDDQPQANTGATTTWDKLRAWVAERDRLAGYESHHKAELKALRAAMEDIDARIHQEIRGSDQPRLFDQQSGASDGDDQEPGGEEPYGEDVGPRL